MGERQNERRQAVRLLTLVDTLYCADRVEGTAVLTNLSSRGALLESESIPPRIGVRVSVLVFLDPASPIRLTGRVVRRTDRGFAIEFEKSDLAVQVLIDELGEPEPTPDGEPRADGGETV